MFEQVLGRYGSESRQCPQVPSRQREPQCLPLRWGTWSNSRGQEVAGTEPQARPCVCWLWLSEGGGTGRTGNLFRRSAFIHRKPAKWSCHNPHCAGDETDSEKLWISKSHSRRKPRPPACLSPHAWLQGTLLPFMASCCLVSKGECPSRAFQALLSLHTPSLPACPPCSLPASRPLRR